MSKPYATEILVPPSEMELELDELLGLMVRADRAAWSKSRKREHTKLQLLMNLKKRQFLAKWRTP